MACLDDRGSRLQMVDGVVSASCDAMERLLRRNLPVAIAARHQPAAQTHRPRRRCCLAAWSGARAPRGRRGERRKLRRKPFLVAGRKQMCWRALPESGVFALGAVSQFMRSNRDATIAG